MNDIGISTAQTIRPMRSGDLEEIARLEARIYQFPWTLGNFKDSLGAGYSCWVMTQGQRIAGYCVVMVGVDEMHLLNLSVPPEFQRTGLGGRFMRHLMEVARSCEARRFLLEVRESNAVARHFYESHRFERIGVRRDYYPADGGREDAIVMELKL